LAALGARVSVVGLIGDDEMGTRLRGALEAIGVCAGSLIVDASRPTSTKTRVVAKGTQEIQQQVVRIDRVDDRPVDGAVRDRMVEAILRQLEGVDALLISDYENGVISREVIEAVLPAGRRPGLTVTVDSHGDLFRFRRVTAATPNQPEVEATLGAPIRSEEELEAAGRRLLEGMEAQAVLITRGSEGLALFEPGRPAYTLPVSIRDDTEVVDPTGAGDTVAAVFTLALASGAGRRAAAFLANVAGGEVVRRLGAASVTPAELARAVRRTSLQPPEG
jgi:rfaE bifunctional protein kinase chain/domain